MNQKNKKTMANAVGVGVLDDPHIKGKNQKGITLIALVITIIVLLILAGVTISMVLGDEGIIQNAQTAKEVTEDADDKEEESLLQANREFAKYNIPKYDDVDDDEGFATKNSTIDGKGVSSSNPVIPKGFKPVDNDDDTTITEEATWGEPGAVDSGLVIQDEDENQFVWVPVPDITKFAVLQEGTSNYRGVLWEFSSTGEHTQLPYEENATYSEPVAVTPDNLEKNIKAIKEEKYSTLQEQFQAEYNYMVSSVKAYGGFYVGRYETSWDGTKVASIGGVEAMTTTTTLEQNWETSLTNNPNSATWYGLYAKQKELYPRSSDESVVSGMIYGAQWDAIMMWMQDIQNVSDGSKKFIIDGSGMGNYSGSLVTTGYYAVNNIFDLAGNYSEFTQERSGKFYRMGRGGDGVELFSDPSSRFLRQLPTAQSNLLSSRIQLYVK